GLEDADRSGRVQSSWRRFHYRNGTDGAGARPAALHGYRRRHQLSHVDGGFAVDRGDRTPRQRAWHDRAGRPAPGLGPYSRAGAWPAGPAAAEGYSGPDREADLPDGRPVDAGARRA